MVTIEHGVKVGSIDAFVGLPFDLAGRMRSEPKPKLVTNKAHHTTFISQPVLSMELKNFDMNTWKNGNNATVGFDHRGYWGNTNRPRPITEGMCLSGRGSGFTRDHSEGGIGKSTLYCSAKDSAQKRVYCYVHHDCRQFGSMPGEYNGGEGSMKETVPVSTSPRQRSLCARCLVWMSPQGFRSRGPGIVSGQDRLWTTHMSASVTTSGPSDGGALPECNTQPNKGRTIFRTLYQACCDGHRSLSS